MLQGKPFFSIRADISGCRYEVRINDVPVISDDNGYPVTVNFPVNEYIANGENELSVYLMPLVEDIYEETTTELTKECKGFVALQVRQSGTPDRENQEISRIQFNGPNDNPAMLAGTTPESKLDSTAGFKVDAGGDVSVAQVKSMVWDFKNEVVPELNYPKYLNWPQRNRIPIEKGAVISQTVSLKSGLPDWAWLQSEQFVENESVRTELYQEYLSLQAQLLSDKLSEDALYPHFSERTKELALAYYVTEKSMLPDGILKCALDKKIYEIYRIEQPIEKEKESFFLAVQGNGRLAAILNWDGSHRLIFNEVAEDGGSTTFPITFRKENGKWIITR